MPRTSSLILSLLLLINLFTPIISVPTSAEYITIPNFANLSFTPSLIALKEQILHENIKFAVALYENNLFLGCACVQTAYLYHRVTSNGPWEVLQTFSPLTAEEKDFGIDVSINRNYFNPTLRLALVGSPSYQNNTGAVYLFREFEPGNWTLTNVLSPGVPGDRFGSSVFLDRVNQFAVGAPNHGPRGIVYIYSLLTDYSFNPIGTLPSPFNPSVGHARGGCEIFGANDIVNTVLIVGACPTSTSVGVAAVYLNLIMISRTSSEILVPGVFYGPSDLSLSLTTRYDGFNNAPSWLVLGQPIDEGIGSVTIYQVVVKGPSLALNTVILGPINPQPGDRYGSSVEIHDNGTNLVLFVGAAGSESTGVVYVYIRPMIPHEEREQREESQKWMFATILRPSDFLFIPGAVIRNFGFTISFDNTVLAVGSSFRHNNVTSPLAVLLDVSLVNLYTPFPLPTVIPTIAPTAIEKVKSEKKDTLDTKQLIIFIPLSSLVIGLVLAVSYYFSRGKLSYFTPNNSYDKKNVLYIQRKQTKQVHCEPDPLTNLEAGMESLKKPRWIIQPSQLTIPVAPNLGSGGYGVVKRGILRDGRRKYDVAVKILLDRHVNSEEFRRVLIREAALMVELRSPYIVEVYGLCDSKMLVLELMNYGSLYTLLETVEPTSFPLAIRTQLMIDSIRGIEYLHDSDVIHADMKSLNILLCTEGGSLKAKISDFGLSRIVNGDCCESTNTNQISIRWAAPEMLQDRPKISKSIDIFAFGVIMWEILSLKRPYADMNLAPLIQKVASGGREPIPPGTPPVIGNLITECWAHLPERRPKAGYVREVLTTWQINFETAGESIIDS